MSYQYFKMKPGTEYAKAVQRNESLYQNWKKVFEKINEYLGEDLKHFATRPGHLWIEYSELKNPDNKKLFKKDGCLKSNTKRAKEVLDVYNGFVKEAGLENYEDLSLINFRHGVFRVRGQHMSGFRTEDKILYYETDFDLEKKSDGLYLPITSIEYMETHLEEEKKRAQKEVATGEGN